METGFHLTFRPRSFEKFLGQQPVVKSIRHKLKLNKLNHALLIVGPSGVGKTTLARIIAGEVGCDINSLVEINAADHNGVDDARELGRAAKHQSLMGGAKVFIIDEAHMLSTQAQNVMLKEIEDSADHAYWIFCTSIMTKIIPTMIRRCSKYVLKPLSEGDLSDLFDRVCKKEKIEYHKKVRSEIIQGCGGSPGFMLMTMYDCNGLDRDDALELIKNGIVGVSSEAIEICRMLFRPRNVQWSVMMEKLDTLVKSTDAESVRNMMFAYFETVLHGATNDKTIALCVNILSEIEAPLRVVGRTTGAGLVYLIGKIYDGICSSSED